MDLSELGYFELQSGDWKCGRMLSDYGLSLLDIAAINNQSIAEAAKSFRQSIALITRSGDQPDDGCPYVIAPLSKVSSSLQNAGGKSKVLESVSTEHSD